MSTTFFRNYSLKIAHELFYFIGQALDLLVSVSYIRYRTYTSDLSTLCSSRGLTSLCYGKLILREASRLDAFYVYPFPTKALVVLSGGTTGAPEVSPSRSSRTKDSSSQISYARDGIGTELSHDVLNPARVPL